MGLALRNCWGHLRMLVLDSPPSGSAGRNFDWMNVGTLATKLKRREMRRPKFFGSTTNPLNTWYSRIFVSLDNVSMDNPEKKEEFLFSLWPAKRPCSRKSRNFKYPIDCHCPHQKKSNARQGHKLRFSLTVKKKKITERKRFRNSFNKSTQRAPATCTVHGYQQQTDAADRRERRFLPKATGPPNTWFALQRTAPPGDVGEKRNEDVQALHVALSYVTVVILISWCRTSADDFLLVFPWWPIVYTTNTASSSTWLPVNDVKSTSCYSENRSWEIQWKKGANTKMMNCNGLSVEW